jgi:hypothetical protein
MPTIPEEKTISGADDLQLSDFLIQQDQKMKKKKSHNLVGVRKEKEDSRKVQVTEQLRLYLIIKESMDHQDLKEQDDTKVSPRHEKLQRSSGSQRSLSL